MGILYLTHIVKPVIFINMVTFPPKTGQNELLDQHPLFSHTKTRRTHKDTKRKRVELAREPHFYSKFIPINTYFLYIYL